ncbi:MAG TPA: alpha/beta fold hydrolase [Solirubrobacteraceae bacterium]|nr:alpha/beta fold hydrolase [Solirubrobacteraceae bacterium]
MSDMTVPERIDVRGVDVAYRRAGSGPPLLLLHGMGLTRRWHELHAALAGRFDVIAPEHPGFGDSAGRPPWYRTLDDLALHYADLMDALDLREAHVAGHSLGGRIAASFAAIFPERVTSLTLIAPAALATVSDAALLDPPAGADAPPPDPGFDFDALLFNDHQDAYPQHRNGDDEGLVVATGDDDPHADPGAWDINGVPSLYRRLARIDCPRQVLVPDEDRLLPRPSFEAWAHWLGDAPLVHVPGREHPTGHLLIVQEPEAIADAIAALARGADAARATP